MKYLSNLKFFTESEKYIKGFESIIDISKISELKITYDNLDELNHLSEYINLKELDCSYNNLESLPELPESLNSLFCENNNLPF